MILIKWALQLAWLCLCCSFFPPCLSPWVLSYSILCAPKYPKQVSIKHLERLVCWLVNISIFLKSPLKSSWSGWYKVGAQLTNEWMDKPLEVFINCEAGSRAHSQWTLLMLVPCCLCLSQPFFFSFLRGLRICIWGRHLQRIQIVSLFCVKRKVKVIECIR